MRSGPRVNVEKDMSVPEAQKLSPEEEKPTVTILCNRSCVVYSSLAVHRVEKN